jgi:hypothetical protein
MVMAGDTAGAAFEQTEAKQMVMAEDTACAAFEQNEARQMMAGEDTAAAPVEQAVVAEGGATAGIVHIAAAQDDTAAAGPTSRQKALAVTVHTHARNTMGSGHEPHRTR